MGALAHQMRGGKQRRVPEPGPGGEGRVRCDLAVIVRVILSK